MRLIDADALIQDITDFPYGYRGMVEAVISNQPTIDAVQIVRCGECKRYHDSLLCSMYSEGMDTPQDWFCADGERKE